jgi:hypothetical protein
VSYGVNPLIISALWECQPPSRPPVRDKIGSEKDLCGCIISHSAATAAVVNFKEAHVFEKLLRNFSKTCASKEFYLPPQAAI